MFLVYLIVLVALLYLRWVRRKKSVAYATEILQIFTNQTNGQQVAFRHIFCYASSQTTHRLHEFDSDIVYKWNVICFNDAKLRWKNEISNCSKTGGKIRKLENERINKGGGWGVRKETEKFGRGLRGILVKKGCKEGGVSL